MELSGKLLLAHESSFHAQENQSSNHFPFEMHVRRRGSSKVSQIALEEKLLSFMRELG
jgi:hypothetical protein